MGEQYHLVKESFGYKIESNNLNKKDQQPRIKGLVEIERTVPRKITFNSLNESRFSTFNRNPSVASTSRRAPQSNFSRQLKRPDQLFDQTSDTLGSFYDSRKEYTMKKLTAGVPLLKKQIGHQTPGAQSW